VVVSTPTPRSVLAKGLVFVGGATLIGNAAAFLLTMIAARILTPDEFGALGALLGMLVIISTISIATQALTARRVATTNDLTDRAEIEGEAIRLSVLVAIVIMLAGLLLAWPLGTLFTIPIVAVGAGIASLGFVVVGSAAMGIAQGREDHAQLSWAFLVNQLGRATGGVIGVLILKSVTGVGLGVLVGCAVGAFLAYRLVCPGAWGRHVSRGVATEFGHVVHALFVLFTLTNVDVLLARLFLDGNQSGEYSVGVQLAKIAFFLPGAIVIVLFPKMTSGGHRRAVYVATGLTAVVGLAITSFSLLFGDLVARILGGKQYTDLGSEIWLFALEGSAFALVQVLLYARLATQDRKAVLAVWAALIVLVTVVVGWRHNSLAEIVTTVVSVSLVLTVAGLIMDQRQGPNLPIPMESAE
jgi:O-antigen/teichoic acid export membrane protein